jgi:hypothetical protein
MRKYIGSGIEDVKALNRDEALKMAKKYLYS